MKPLKHPFTCSTSFLNSTPELIFVTGVYCNSQLGSNLCSAQEIERNFAARATQPSVTTETPWLAGTSSMMMSQGCGSHTNISSCTLCPPLKICSSASLGYSSCLADRQQPGMIIGDHNLSEQIPVAFVSGCCAFSIIGRSQRKSDPTASAVRAVGRKEHRKRFGESGMGRSVFGI